jgi:hypothetical protein
MKTAETWKKAAGRGRGRRPAAWWFTALVAALPFVARAADGAGLETLGPLSLPGAAGSVGLDDLQYDAALGRVLVPAGESGNLDLVDPVTGAVTAVAIADAHVTSAAVAGNLLLTSDRKGLRLLALDAISHRVVASAPLAAGPDYVRYLATRGEVWVTEPRAESIEIFSLTPGTPPSIREVAKVAVPGGPEALAIDPERGRAYSNLWRERTVAIDLAQRAVVENWASGCAEPRGLALDAPRTLLLVGCKDGTVTSIDVGHAGKILSTLKPGDGTDIVAFDPGRRHLYVPGGRSATLAVVGVGESGALTLLATASAAERSHCVTTDGDGLVYVCDPVRGRLLVYRDGLPPPG